MGSSEIGIGVLCSAIPQARTSRPDAFVLVSDLVETTETSSANELQKTFVYSREKLFCLCVGRIEMAVELVPLLRSEFQRLKARNHKTLAEAVNKAVYDHRAEQFRLDALPRYYLLPGDSSGGQQREITEAWQRYDTGVHLLVASFDDDGQAVMYLIAGMDDGKWVRRSLFPGVSTIGTGAQAAYSWLGYRGQAWGSGLKQSAYHAYEAKRVATRGASDTNLEMIIATNEKQFHLAGNEPEADKSPVSLAELKELFTQYGPRATDVLGGVIVSPKKSKAAKVGKE